MADTSGSATPKMWCSMPERLQLHLAMLALQFGYAGFHVVSRAALNMGISKIVFTVYRNVLALILLLPFAYFLEKKERPPITLSFLVQFFLLAVVGITANQGFYLLGLDNTSPTFASAIQNSVHYSGKIEQVRLDRKDGVSKVVGTVLCITGASVITLYKGPTIYSPTPSLQQVSPALLALGDARGKNWTLGCLFLVGHCFSWAGWLVLQAPILKKYPARLSVTSYQCFFGVIQFLVIAAFLERDPQAWLVHSGEELFSVFYAGVVASGIAFAVQIWCIDRMRILSLQAWCLQPSLQAFRPEDLQRRLQAQACKERLLTRIDRGGPVFVALYQPVQTLVVALMASVLLGEEFYLGGIIGAVLIIAGLYFVLWGKNEERKFSAQKAVVQSPADHGNNRTTTHIKSSLASQPKAFDHHNLNF